MFELFLDKIRRLLRKIYIRSMLRAGSGSGSETIIYGSEYGGYAVDRSRIENCKGSTIIVYSFGIGEDLSFSEDMIRNVKCEVYAFDPTPRSEEYVKRQKIYKNPYFHFYQYGISVRNDREIFYLPKNQNYVSGSLEYHAGVSKSRNVEVELKTLDRIMEELGHKKIDILKMDVEGEEFSVIKYILDKDIKTDQICVEIHDRFFVDGRKRLKNMLGYLKEKGYKLIYVSKSYEELTFVKMS